MSTTARNLKASSLIRGDKWDGFFYTITIPDEPDFNFAGTVVSAQIRKKRDGSEANNTILHEFNVTPDTSVLGECTFTLNIEGAITATFPLGKIYGDVEFIAPDGLGPYTITQFIINVKADTTL